MVKLTFYKEIAVHASLVHIRMVVLLLYAYNVLKVIIVVLLLVIAPYVMQGIIHWLGSLNVILALVGHFLPCLVVMHALHVNLVNLLQHPVQIVKIVLPGFIPILVCLAKFVLVALVVILVVKYVNLVLLVCFLVQEQDYVLVVKMWLYY